MFILLGGLTSTNNEIAREAAYAAHNALVINYAVANKIVAEYDFIGIILASIDQKYKLGQF